MKKLLLSLAICAGLSFTSQAQIIDVPVDRSPLDVCFYPHKYPNLAAQHKQTDSLMAKLYYSRPQKNGRKIFGDLVEMHKIWRFGANEASELETYRNLKINNQVLPAGRYSLYAIPDSSSWTFVFNRKLNTWGAFDYDSTQDVLRVSAAVTPIESPVEVFTTYFDKNGTGFTLNVVWDNFRIILPFELI